MLGIEKLSPRKSALLLTVGLAAGGVMLTGCSEYNDERGRGDAPVGERHEDPRQIWQNLDKFPNVSAFCIGENGVYTNTGDNRDPVDIIVSDPNCAEGGILYDPTEN